MREIFSSEVQIPTYSGQLSGTLNFSSNKGNSIAMLLLSDADAADRDGNSANGINRSACLKYLAEDLARFGIVTLRYDQRDFAKNEHSLQNDHYPQVEDYVEDAIHAVQYIKNQLRFSKVIIAGHGEGSLVAMLAAQSAAVDGFVSIAGREKNMANLLRERLQHQLTPGLLIEAEKIITQLSDGCIADAVPSAFEELFSDKIQPYLISLFQYEPSQEIKKLTVPIMILHGNRDLEVPFSDANALKSHVPKAELVFVDGMNHVLKKVSTDSDLQIDYYQNPVLPVCRLLVTNLLAFVGKVLRNNTNPLQVV